jgi:hypothetical protein
MWAVPSASNAVESCCGIEFDWAASDVTIAIVAARGRIKIFIATFVSEGNEKANANHSGHKVSQRNVRILCATLCPLWSRF